MLDRLGAIDGDLVIGAVTLLDAEIEILQVNIQIGKDQLILDPLPDDTGHFIAIQFNDGIGNLDLAHGTSVGLGLSLPECRTECPAGGSTVELVKAYSTAG